MHRLQLLQDLRQGCMRLRRCACYAAAAAGGRGSILAAGGAAGTTAAAAADGRRAAGWPCAGMHGGRRGS